MRTWTLVRSVPPPPPSPPEYEPGVVFWRGRVVRVRRGPDGSMWALCEYAPRRRIYVRVPASAEVREGVTVRFEGRLEVSPDGRFYHIVAVIWEEADDAHVCDAQAFPGASRGALAEKRGGMPTGQRRLGAGRGSDGAHGSFDS